jgi:hypothetical protein
MTRCGRRVQQRGGRPWTLERHPFEWIHHLKADIRSPIGPLRAGFPSPPTVRSIGPEANLVSDIADLSMHGVPKEVQHLGIELFVRCLAVEGRRVRGELARDSSQDLLGTMATTQSVGRSGRSGHQRCPHGTERRRLAPREPRQSDRDDEPDRRRHAGKVQGDRAWRPGGAYRRVLSPAVMVRPWHRAISPRDCTMSGRLLRPRVH